MAEWMEVALLVCPTAGHATSKLHLELLYQALVGSPYLMKITNMVVLYIGGARGGAIGWRNALQVGRSRVRFPMVSLEFFIDNPSCRTMTLGSTQPLTEMSTRNISWG